MQDHTDRPSWLPVAFLVEDAVERSAGIIIGGVRLKMQ